MSDLSKQFAFLAGLFIDFNESVDNSVVAPAPLPLKRDVGPFLFYSKGGERILCNPNPLDHPNPFLPPVLAVLFPTRDIMSPKISRPLFSPSSQDRSLSTFPKPVFRRILRFFPPNLNLHLASLFAIFPNFFLVLSWLVDSIFVDRSTVQSDVTDKRKPFERMGRKTSDLSNGSWVTQVTSGLFLAHSFEAKNGLFVYGPSYRGGQL